MNRREAIATLTAMPAVTRIARADLAPGDVIVVESDKILSRDAIQSIEAGVARVWPGRKVVVFSEGLRMKVIAGR